jgi:hypothetical protein
MHAVGAVDQTLRRPFGQFRSPLGTGPLRPQSHKSVSRVSHHALARCHLKNLSEIARCFTGADHPRNHRDRCSRPARRASVHQPCGSSVLLVVLQLWNRRQLQLVEDTISFYKNGQDPLVISLRHSHGDAIAAATRQRLKAGGFCITPRKGSIQDYAPKVEPKFRSWSAKSKVNAISIFERAIQLRRSWLMEA